MSHDSNDDKIMKDGLKFVVDNDYKMWYHDVITMDGGQIANYVGKQNTHP